MERRLFWWVQCPLFLLCPDEIVVGMDSVRNSSFAYTSIWHICKKISLQLNLMTLQKNLLKGTDICQYHPISQRLLEGSAHLNSTVILTSSVWMCSPHSVYYCTLFGFINILYSGYKTQVNLCISLLQNLKSTSLENPSLITSSKYIQRKTKNDGQIFQGTGGRV